jgi:hypothetical protein
MVITPSTWPRTVFSRLSAPTLCSGFIPASVAHPHPTGGGVRWLYARRGSLGPVRPQRRGAR